MVDSQNTAAGTINGTAATPDNGNSLLSLFTGLGNVISDAGDKAIDWYSSFNDSNATAKANAAQTATPPAQTAPANVVNNPADFLSNPAKVKSLVTILIIGSLAIGALLIVVKKV